MEIRQAQQKDAQRIAEIYNHFIKHTVVTFEETHVSADEIWQRVSAVQATSYPYLVGEMPDQVIAGYAYGAQWKNRSAYRFAAEVSIYLAPEFIGQGLGARLYRELIQSLREQGIHSVMGGIALPNDASVALHEKLGFQKVAHFKELGWKQSRWIDVGYWELDLGNREFPEHEFPQQE